MVQTLIRWQIETYCQQILVYYHQISHHRMLILDLMGKLERQRIEELFTKVTKVKE